MNLDEELQPIEEPTHLTPARRRRARRSLIPSSSDGRAEILENLSRKAFPSFEFFFYSLLAGIMIGFGYLIDSQPILFLGVLIVPLLSPWIGMILATVTGSMRFFLQTLVGFLIGMGLIFGSGLLAGKASLMYPPPSFMQATMHSHLWLTVIGLVILGAILLVTAFIRSEKRPIIPSLMLAYGLYLPLSIAGFGYGSGSSEFWNNGILVFSVHIAIATLTGLITLFFVKFFPRRSGGCLMTLIIGAAAFITFIWVSGAYVTIQDYFEIPWNIPAPPYQQSNILETQTTVKVETPSATIGSMSTITAIIEKTPTAQITSTNHPTNTIAPVSTSQFAVVDTLNGEGVNVRDNPDGNIISSLADGSQVEILPDILIVDGTTWLHIITPDGLEGWIIQEVVLLITPEP